MFDTMYLILLFIGLLGVLIFAHELGHFLLAKKLGVGVLKFSLGFGPKLIGKKIGETEYLISAFPLGGYVKMLGESPDEEVNVEQEQKSFSLQPPWKRMVIVVAGPVFNILLTVFLYTFIYIYGISALSAVVGYVEKDSPAYHAGLKTGDKIVELNGMNVEEWEEVSDLISESADKELAIKLLREGQEMVVRVIPEKEMGQNLFMEPDEVGSIGIWPFITSVVGKVTKGSPAEAAGLKEGDKIISIEGVEVGQWSEVVDIVRENPEKEISLTVERGQEVMDIKVVPISYTDKLEDGSEITIGRIGITYGEPIGRNFIVQRYNPFTAFFMGLGQTWNIVKLTVIVVKKLVVREIPAKTIAGPIGIAQMTGQVAKQGFSTLLAFMALLSINLGILNLFPIPILDGGHLLFFVMELIMGKPLSEKKMEFAQKVGLMLIILLMVLAFYNDISRVFGAG